MYNKVWIAFVDVTATSGHRFNELVDMLNQDTSVDYKGGWANILVICDRINEVPEIIEKGLNELLLTVKFIDKIENLNSNIEYGEVEEGIIKEADWLLSSPFIFKICDKIFPYTEIDS